MGKAAQLGITFMRAYPKPAAPRTIQPISSAARKPFCLAVPGGDWLIGLILAFGLLSAMARAEDPPENLAKLVAHRESETQAERNEYMYRQTVTIDEMD